MKQINDIFALSTYNQILHIVSNVWCVMNQEACFKIHEVLENAIKLFLREEAFPRFRGALHDPRVCAKVSPSRDMLTTASVGARELLRCLAILNVFRNLRIRYCIAPEPNTNCSIITISRCTPDTPQRRWSAGAGECPEAN